ncbi:MAG: helix-turn-helix domain-containing protein [Sulfurospirillaceae bacterium]|nr:helix-turn-helix domain-containing protein [Sulfurospirillaceae bacterium]
MQTLGHKELELIEFLLENHHRTISKELIEAKLWNYEVQCNSAVKNLVLRVRKKLGNDVISVIRGVGYRINLDKEFTKNKIGD